MLKFDDNRLFVTEITDCKCCGDLKEGYLAYLLSINEINGFIYLTIHNYNVLYEVFNKSILS
ncbi:hypothetical protein NBO_10g0038 [Nosema bombycis CQ1]|uniref:Uncharacterized protein n=1 Tax=Nosema bombycis (strain CQ1 / CVCC 102059) TaxID=578461 RepID=R0MQ92_NOSB1|nr:hypothetical protein NBO_10g0038 [Nosema bombycis CQ1]|eukprot:EOB15048.1 hypothetical protein NBO_10g0038 [Nosema bombycis CQ1]